MEQQIIAMLELQDGMNTKVHPDWRNQGYAWHRAIWVECAELMEHHGWKWWKKQSPDRDQVILELVDIWHFGLSILLLEGRSRADIAATVAAAIDAAPEAGDFLADVERFTLATLANRRFEVSLFATLMKGVGLDFDDLYARYAGKNVLNLFRQDQGYQSGGYRKTWQGREDNEHLMEILNELDRASHSFRDDLYRSLELRYRISDDT
ncbi:MAG: dUTP diphosphatase [Pseudomonadota bacterium]|nr:dUTP diphosphatase [Pseudomonadota bacterium]